MISGYQPEYLMFCDQQDHQHDIDQHGEQVKQAELVGYRQ